MTTTATQTATTAATVTALTALATSVEQSVLNSACVVWTYRLATCVVDLVVSRRGGRIVRAHVLEIGDGAVWHHFTGTPSANARAVMAAVR